jgi:hypothetical protein
MITLLLGHRTDLCQPTGLFAVVVEVQGWVGTFWQALNEGAVEPKEVKRTALADQQRSGSYLKRARWESARVLLAVQVPHCKGELVRVSCHPCHDPGGTGIHARPELGCQAAGLPRCARREHPAPELEPHVAGAVGRPSSWPGGIQRRRASFTRHVCLVGHGASVAAYPVSAESISSVTTGKSCGGGRR